MNVRKAVFVGSFGDLSRLPAPGLPEIAFVGRANVGKSTLINRLLGVRNLALTSSKPGKTRTVNFFRVNDDCFFVDLPGYGFSRVSKREQDRWRDLIEGYLLGRHTLRLLVHLMDARHGPLANDEQLHRWVSAHRLPYLPVLTKTDKLSRSRLSAERRGAEGGDGALRGVMFSSAVTGAGLKEIWKAIENRVETSK
jgi:GTP-binding protein